MRQTFTLHARFRYARSTFFDLYLNHKSNLRVLPTGPFRTLCRHTYLTEARPLRAGVFGDNGAMDLAPS